MSTGDELVGSARVEALAAAYAIAFSMLTDDQVVLIAADMAGNSARQIEAKARAVQPPQEHRTGITIPYWVAGPLREFPLNLHGVAVLLGGLMSLGGPKEYSFAFSDMASPQIIKDAKARSQADAAMAACPRALTSHPAPLASRTLYENWKGPSPAALRELAEAVSPAQFWGSLGVSPRSLALGFDGLSPIKGSTSPMMSPGATPGTNASRTSRDADFETAAESAAADIFRGQ